MNGIFRLFKGELKKIFSGAGIFVMSALLILTLTVCPKVFSPTEKIDTLSQVNLSTESVEAARTSFLFAKDEYDNNLNIIISDINEFISSFADFKGSLMNDLEMVRITRTAFQNSVSSEEIEGSDGAFFKLGELKSAVNTLYDNYNSFINAHFFPLILVSEKLNYDISSELLSFKHIIEQTGDNTLVFFTNIDTAIDEFNFLENLSNTLNNVKNLNYASFELTEILSNYSTLKSAEKNALLDEITAINDISTINKNSIKYLSLTNNLTNILSSKFLLSITQGMPDNELSDYLGFENFNSYYYKENFTKNLFMLENELSDNEIANVFSFNVSSFQQITAYDYMFFAMEIITFLIVTFTVILGAGIVSKEFSEGTLRLLALKPYRRSKIIFSKILATIFVGFLLMIISAIVAFITGIIIYGTSFPTVLVVANATTAFTTSSTLLMLMYLGSLTVKIWLFSLIAIVISVLFRSYILSVSLSAGLYLINLILTFVANGANWLRFSIFSHFDLFKYFGGGFLKPTITTNVTNLFSNFVFSGTNFTLSLIIICSLIIVLNTLIFTVFKRRDI